jgi:hypothetical protein
MAIALVQNSHASGAVTGATAAVALPGASTAGNMLSLHGSVVLNASGVGISSVTDGTANSWTVSTSTVTAQNPPIGWAPSGTMYATFCAWVLNAASATTITLTMAGSVLTFWNVIAAEWSGVGSSDTAAASGTTAGAGLSLSQGLTLAGSGELVLLASDTTNQWTSGPSQATAFSSGGSPYSVYALSQSGSQTYTWSGATNSTDTATAAVAAFRPPAGSAPAGTVPDHVVVARRSLARAVWHGFVSSTVNGTPVVPPAFAALSDSVPGRARPGFATPGDPLAPAAATPVTGLPPLRAAGQSAVLRETYRFTQP